MTGPITPAELAAVATLHIERAAQLRSRGLMPRAFGRKELADALLDHWLARRAEIARQEGIVNA